jgi:DNA-binding CsgD family transcriptional regulator
MREVTYAAIASANRIAIHERVASAIEKHHGLMASRHAREIANHLLSAGGLANPSKTVRYCTIGAQQARALFASEEMLRLTQGAVAALERLPIQTPRLRARHLLEQAYAETMLGHPDAALVIYEQALRIYRELGDDEGETDCNRWIATTLLRYGRFVEAIPLAEQALARAPGKRTHAYIALAGAYALAALVDGRFEEVGTWANKLLELGFDAETLAIANHAAAGHCSWGVGDPNAALQHFEECRDNFLAIGNDGTAAQVAADQTVAAYLLGHVERSREVFVECTELAERTNRITAVTELSAYTAVIKTHEGDWEAARSAEEHWKTSSSEMGGSTIYGQLLERALVLQRLWREGPQIEMDALQSSSPLRNEPLQAYLLAERGELEQAAGIVSTIKQMVPADGSGLFWLSIALPMTAAQIALKDKDVEAWLPGLERYPGATFDWFNVDIELGRAYALLEDWGRADDCFSRAIAKCEGDGLCSFVGVAHYHYGLMLLERRERNYRKQGLVKIKRARELFSEIGMEYLRAKAHRALPKTTSDRASARHPGDLTPREWEILNQLAGGHTNEEISDLLVISRRTVEYHLQNLYGKISVRSRAAAIAWLAKQSTVESTAS